MEQMIKDDIKSLNILINKSKQLVRFHTRYKQMIENLNKVDEAESALWMMEDHKLIWDGNFIDDTKTDMFVKRYNMLKEIIGEVKWKDDLTKDIANKKIYKIEK